MKDCISKIVCSVNVKMLARILQGFNTVRMLAALLVVHMWSTGKL
jgi:hypothetical protein